MPQSTVTPTLSPAALPYPGPWSTVLAMLGILAVLALCYAATKYMAGRSGGGAGGIGSYIRVIDRMGLARDKAVFLLDVGGQFLLVGVSNQEITLLTRLDGELQPVQEKRGKRNLGKPSFDMKSALETLGKKAESRQAESRPTEFRQTESRRTASGKSNSDAQDGFISASEGFEQLLKTARQREEANGAPPDAIDELGDKIKQRGEKFRSKKDL